MAEANSIDEVVSDPETMGVVTFDLTSGAASRTAPVAPVHQFGTAALDLPHERGLQGWQVFEDFGPSVGTDFDTGGASPCGLRSAVGHNDALDNSSFSGALVAGLFPAVVFDLGAADETQCWWHGERMANLNLLLSGHDFELNLQFDFTVSEGTGYQLFFGVTDAGEGSFDLDASTYMGFLHTSDPVGGNSYEVEDIYGYSTNGPISFTGTGVIKDRVPQTDDPVLWPNEADGGAQPLVNAVHLTLYKSGADAGMIVRSRLASSGPAELFIDLGTVETVGAAAMYPVFCVRNMPSAVTGVVAALLGVRVWSGQRAIRAG